MARIVAFTINPSIDLSSSVARIEPERKLRCAPPRRYPGGGGVNVARVLVRLGADVRLLYPAGGDTGLLLRHLIDDEGIPSVPVEVAEETREDLSIIEETTDREYRFVFPGPPLTADEWRACLDGVVSLSKGAAYVVASGSLPPGVPPDFYARIARIAKQQGAKLVLDASGEPLRLALDEGVHIIKPNLRELVELVGDLRYGADDMARAAREIVEAGKAEIVAVTLGADGALLSTGARAWTANVAQAQAVSTVGAGDSFLGALVWALDAGRTPVEALRYGVAAGAAAVASPGTALASVEQIQFLLPAVDIRRLPEHSPAA